MRWPHMRKPRRLCKLIGKVSAGAAAFISHLAH